MATKNIVPRATHEGQLGRVDKVWSAIHVDGVYADNVEAEGEISSSTISATGSASVGSLTSAGNVQATGYVSGTNGSFTGSVSAGSISSSGGITGSTLTLTSNTADTLFWLTRKGLKQYQVGDIAYSPKLPSWARLECIQAGQTSVVEPTYGSVQQGTLITDGTVRWIVDDIRDATMTGGIIYLPFTKTGYLVCTGQTVNRSDYPRLVKFATDNSLWTSNQTNEPWKFGNGNGSTTMTVPNYLARVIQGGSTTAKLEAGLPNIVGDQDLGGYSGKNTSSSGAYADTLLVDNLTFSTVISAETQIIKTTFDASRSNPIYGNSSTVQPPAIQLIPQIKY